MTVYEVIDPQDFVDQLSTNNCVWLYFPSIMMGYLIFFRKIPTV